MFTVEMEKKVLQRRTNSAFKKDVFRITEKNKDVYIRKNYTFPTPIQIEDQIRNQMKFFQTYFAPHKFNYEFGHKTLGITCDLVISESSVLNIEEFFKLYTGALTKVNRIDDSYHFCFSDGNPVNFLLVNNELLGIDESKLLFSIDKTFIKLKAMQAGIKYIASNGWTSLNTLDYIMDNLMEVVNEVYE